MRERKGERERGRESAGDEATRFRSDKRYKNAKKEKIIDIYVTVIFGERLSCARSRRSILKGARFSRPFAILSPIAKTKLWRTILILAYPTIEALLFLLYLDYLIEPETHTSGLWPEENSLSSTVLHQAGFTTSTDILVGQI